MFLLLIITLTVTCARAQQNACSCSCCLGQSCSPILLSNTSMQFCTTQACRTSCRSLHPQCQAEYPYGQMIALCTWSVSTLFNCACHCCRDGTLACTPTLVGDATAYQCHESSCSIACYDQYPAKCAGDHTGQTIGTCTGPITTTTSTTSTTSISTASGTSVGNRCSCGCCQSGPGCMPNIYVGDATVSPCTTGACTEACKTTYPSSCPSQIEYGRVNGTCTNQNTGNKGHSKKFESDFLLWFIVFLLTDAHLLAL
ncbi:unnamed protein product [Adineta ricciae]|uniref:Uncharacterized protein n=1 Tax=Adineta ricciae TaxID=249248 RepID=A0A813NN56_ADIRI|nr:unnamed protein product [Adineta ricciae]CAF0744184.1 unnamed protein product [Adineta ricciae]